MSKTSNPYAKSLSDAAFKTRIVQSKKGKGSYKRKEKNKNASEYQGVPSLNEKLRSDKG